MRKLVAGALVSMVTVVALAGPASAHAQLISTQPASGAVLASSPTAVTVRFDESVGVRPDGLQLRDATGTRVDHGGLRRIDGGRTIQLPVSDLPNGGYVVTWRVVSADGHPVSGGVSWRIGLSSTAVDSSVLQQALNAEGGDAVVHGFAAAFRALLYAALVVLVGGLLFLPLAWPDGAGDARLRTLFRVATMAGVVATIAGMGLQGADVAGLTLARAVRPGTVVDTFGSTYGKAALARLVLLVVLAALAMRATPAVVRTLAWQSRVLAVAAATMLTLTVAGHARTGRWVPLALPIDLVHLLAGAAWLGGLAVLSLVVLPRDDEGSTTPVVRRFSSVAAASVLVVVVTGSIQGLRQLDGLDSLRTTSYGRFLVLKVVTVALVVVVGALSRSLVRVATEERVLVGAGGPPPPQPADDEDDEYDDDDAPLDPVELRRALRRSVAAEAVLAVAVLVITSFLVAADPSRTIGSTGFSQSKVVNGTVIEVSGSPARTGPVDFHLYASDTSVGLTAKLDASAELALPERGIAPLKLALATEGRAHWSAYNVEVPIRGTWKLVVTIGLSTFEVRTTTFSIPIS